MTLLAFAAERLAAWRRASLLRRQAAAATDRYRQPAGPTAANQLQRYAAVDRWDRQTNGHRTLPHRPYCASSVNNLHRFRPTGIVADFHGAMMATASGEKLLIGRRPVRNWTHRTISSLLLCRKLHLFLGKSTKTAATRAARFDSNMHQIVCRLGLCPRPHWGSLQRSPRSPSCI